MGSYPAIRFERRTMPPSSSVRAGPALVTGLEAPCDACGGPTVERHCKVICTRCGHTRDCSDP